MKKLVTFIIALLISLPFSAHALSGNVNMNCDKVKLGSGESANCTISMSVISGELTSFTGDVSSSSNLTISDFKLSSGWEGNGDNGKYVLYTDAGKTGNVGIGSFKVTAKGSFNENGTVLLGGISLGDETFNENSKADIVKSFAPKSTNSSLNSLSVSGVMLSPAFVPTKTSYTATADVSSINISATAEGSISGVGAKTLNYGENKFQIVVTAEAGNTTTYTIVINRPDNRSGVNTLKSLKLSEGSVDFSSDKTSYNISVSSKIDSIKVTSSLTDSKSRYIAGSSSMNVKLNYGVNTVKITVQAENGSNKTYTIKITRKDDRSKDNTLKVIKLANISIDIDNEKDDYEIKVPYGEESIDIEAITNFDGAKVEIIGDKALNVGENLFEIKVTAENGDVKTYKLKVIRQEEDVVLSSDSSLKSLIIVGHEINFSKNKKNYVLKTKKDKLEIKAIPSDENAKVEIKNNAELKDGSIITIAVTADDGTSTKYEIKIEKANNLLLPILCTILVLVFGGILLFVFLKRKKK